MKKSIISFAAVLLSASFYVAYAQQTDSKVLKLTVDEAVNYAMENSLSLKSSAIDLEIKKRGNTYSWNTFLPSASVSGTLARSNNIDQTKSGFSSAISTMTMAGVINAHNPLVNYSAPTDDEVTKALEDEYGSLENAHWHPVGSLSLQWNFNLAMIDAIRSSKKLYEGGKITWEKTCRDTEVNIRKLFYGILMMQENLKIQQESLKNAEARWHQAEINYKNGRVPELSVLNSRVTYENMRPNILSAQQQLKQQIDMFGFLLGLPYGQQIVLEGTIDTDFIEVDADQLYQKYIEQNNEIRSLKNNIALLKIKINATCLSTYTPSLSLGWGLSPTVSNITKSWTDDTNYSEGGNFTVTLVYSNLFNMLPFSSNMQGLKDTKQQLAQAELGLQQLYQNAEMQIHNSVDNLAKCKANIQAMNNNIQLAQKAYNSTLQGYNNGQQELLDVRDSESALNQARLGLMNEKMNYITEVLELETRLNTKLTK